MVKPVLLIRGDNNVADQEALAKLGIESLTDPYIEINVANDSHDGENILALDLFDATLHLVDAVLVDHRHPVCLHTILATLAHVRGRKG